MTSENVKKWFVIEGNIGTGKSTFLNKLNQQIECEVIFEPLDEWINTKDNNGKNILDHFYNDSKRWCFTFQVNALITRAQSICKKQNKNLRFVERSIFTDKNVFALNSLESKFMNTMEMSLYNKYFDWIQTYNDSEPDGIIYLRTQPETSFERIKKRSRSEEDVIPLEYIKNIHEKHDNWLSENSNLEKKILVLDASQNFENYENILKKKIQEIKEFFKL